MRGYIIVSNKARCSSCGDTLESKGYRWDFRQCQCKQLYLFGGREYLGRSHQGNKKLYVELSELIKK